MSPPSAEKPLPCSLRIAPSGPTSSDPNGWSPPSRARRATSNDRRRNASWSSLGGGEAFDVVMGARFSGETGPLTLGEGPAVRQPAGVNEFVNDARVP